ncbi:MAG TPA: response regulator transcription factor [Thermomicrobiales bacterium]
MPGMNGIEATRRIVQANPALGIVVLTMFEDDDSVFAAMRAGARGYIRKGADQFEMLRTARAVANGETHFGPAIASRLLAFFAGKPATLPVPFPELTDREREILNLIAAGRSNAEIADALFSARRRCAITSRISSANCTWPTARRRSFAPAKLDSAPEWRFVPSPGSPPH